MEFEHSQALNPLWISSPYAKAIGIKAMQYIQYMAMVHDNLITVLYTEDNEYVIV